MTGVDTNVLVRYLLQDDGPQARLANRFFDELVASGDRCAIGVVVLCELVWVLRGAYGVDRKAVVTTIDRLLSVGQIELIDRDIIVAALARYRRGPGDFADYVISESNRHAGCAATVTFDKKLQREPAFQLL
ncbi:MAG: type II toxin-antitoxin system VapC family toxin [Vicinamibacteria bacterium]|nr:type II toxin-antitoxin system VapC family toxin [Vicinamibacteria bacterium]